MAHLGLAGREVGTMELLALGRAPSPRQGGGRKSFFRFLRGDTLQGHPTERKDSRKNLEVLQRSMAVAAGRRCGSCASRQTCTLAGAMVSKRAVPPVTPAKTVFKRDLPSDLVAFSSRAGRSLFMQAPAPRIRRP